MKKIEQCEPEGVVTLLRKLRYWTVCLIFIFGLLMSLNLSAGISENAPAITDNLKISTGFAADTIVRGRVVGTQKEPLSGVSIKLEGTSDASGTLTNADGQYSITVREGDKVLIFSYVGYLSQRVAIGDQVSVNVVLQKGDQQMEEVVVVGYGTKKRADLTGAVVTIGNKELKQTPTLNISNSLVGRLPGVIANNRSGEPGNDGSSILIRGMSTLGDNAPLIVIDGVADRGSLDRLDPNEIESISVLKDASAAIYGSRAANGVILVTTKRGKMGKPRVAYDFGHAWVTRTRTPIQNNAYEYALAYNEMFKNDGLAPFYSEEDIQKYKDGSDPVTHPNTNWAKEVFKKHANQDRHSLTVNGGTERIRYFVSLGYQAQDGINRNSATGYKQYNFRSNIDANISKNFKIGLDLSGRQEDRRNSGATTTDIGTIASYDPTTVAIYPNGLYGTGPFGGRNPLISWSSASGYTNSTTNYFNSALSYELQIPFIKGLYIDGFVAVDRNYTYNKRFRKPFTVYNYNKGTGEYDAILFGDVVNPDLSESAGYLTSITPNVKLNYQRSFGIHQLNGFVAYEQNKYATNEFSAYRKNFLSPAIDQLFAGDTKDQATNGSANLATRRNYFGRLGYGYQDKYLVDFNFRVDGSANFPKHKRYGFFPGISAAWKLSEEKFIKEADAIDHMKIRLSYGEMGNDRVAAYQYLSSYSYDAGYVLGQTPTTVLGISPNVVPNANITWEVAQTSNIGYEASFWNGLLGVEVDIFKTTRSNILARRNASVPGYTGISLPNENIGKVENKGIELRISHRSSPGKNLRYNVSGNVTFAKNKIIFIDEAAGAIPHQTATGRSIGSELMYNAIGVFQNQAHLDSYPHQPHAKVGDLVYEDYDKDGLITAKDMIRNPKSTTPELIFGLLFNSSWKQFDMNFLFQGQGRASLYFFPPRAVMMKEWVEQSWTPENSSAQLPLLRDWARYPERSTAFLRNAAFLRLKQLEVGYTASPKILSKISFSSLRIYANGFNLVTWTKLGIDAIDPETISSWGSQYPQQKIFNLGLNLNF